MDHWGGAPFGSLVFRESRSDLRIVQEQDRAPDVVATRLDGLAVRLGADSHAALFLSDPDPSDPERLIRAVSDGSGPVSGAGRGPLPSGPTGDSGRIAAFLEDLLARESRYRPSSPWRLAARWVEFDQAVLVARPGRPTATDRRQGRRLRLDAWVRVHGQPVRATVERVLRPRDPLPAPEALLEALRECAAARCEARPASAGERTIVFASGAGGVLIHEVVGHVLEADSAAGGTALGPIGTEVAPPEVTVVDDPRRGRAAWRIDDEGETAAAAPLVRSGRTAGYLDDLATASRAGRKPTGHGRRSTYREPVRPRMGCTFLAAGPLAPAEAIEDTRQGVLVRRMESGHIDPLSGRASFRVTDASAIVNGTEDAPLEPFVLLVQGPSALRAIDRVADDVSFDPCVGSCSRDGQPLATSVGAPTFRLGVGTVVC